MVDRRQFLTGAAALACFSPRLAFAGETLGAGWRVFEVTTRIEPPAGPARAWVPLPSVSAADWIRPLDNRWRIEGGHAEQRAVGAYGAQMIAAQWPDGSDKSTLEVVSRIAAHDRAVNLDQPRAVEPLAYAERRLFTAPTQYLPTDGIVKATAETITAGAATDLDKARRIYDWLVVNAYRNPATRGCGEGDIAKMLAAGDLGGKCADINGLYVGLARAVGLPARDLYGVRVAPSRLGFKSLGANSEVISKSQHCRAEVYLEGFGWTPVDPADVRKVALEEPPGHLALDSAPVAKARQMLFGAWETNWIAYNQAHDVALPGSAGAALPFLMYPHVETAAGGLDCYNPDGCKYTITAKEIAV